jgi:chemotaxis signal transduction protein
MALGSSMPMAGNAHTRSVSQELRVQRDVLTFAISDEEYAIGIEHIREIIKYRPITEVPRVPAFVAGIIAVRGLVMPVLDLRMRLRLRAAPLAQKARILIISRPAVQGELLGDEERERFGLIVDRVNEVVRIHEQDIEPPTVLSGHESDFIEGIGRLRQEEEDLPRAPSPKATGPGMISAEPQRIIILLELARVLSFDHAGSGRML